MNNALIALALVASAAVPSSASAEQMYFTGSTAELTSQRWATNRLFCNDRPGTEDYNYFGSQPFGLGEVDCVPVDGYNNPTSPYSTIFWADMFYNGQSTYLTSSIVAESELPGVCHDFVYDQQCVGWAETACEWGFTICCE